MSQPSQVTRPAPFVWFVALVVFGQAIAMALNAVFTIFDTESGLLSGPAKVFLVFLFALGAVWLTATAIGVLQGKAWPRGALVVAEVLAVIVSFTYFQLGDMLLGSALLISGGIVLIGLFTPALTSHLVQRRGQQD